MKTQRYLQVVLCLLGGLYAFFGVWCLFWPESTSRSLGMHLSDATALSEYMTVYGGLEIGLAMAMWICMANKKLLLGGYVFSLILSCALPIFRIASLIRYDVNETSVLFLFIESKIAVLLLIPLLVKDMRKSLLS